MKQVLTIVLVAAIVAPLGMSQEAPTAKGLKIEAVGLSVAMKDEDDKFNRSLARMLQPGTRVFFRISGAEGDFISIDDDNSKVILSPEGGGEIKDAEIGPFPAFSKDHKSVVVEVKTANRPPAQAKALKVRGTLIATTGSAPKTVTVKDFELKKDNTLKLGTLPMAVSEIGEGWGDAKMTVEFTNKVGFDAVKKLEIIDEDGKVRECGEHSSGYMGFGDKITYSKSWKFPVKADKLTLRISYYSKSEQKKIPLDQTVSLGL